MGINGFQPFVIYWVKRPDSYRGSNCLLFYFEIISFPMGIIGFQPFVFNGFAVCRSMFNYSDFIHSYFFVMY